MYLYDKQLIIFQKQCKADHQQEIIYGPFRLLLSDLLKVISAVLCLKIKVLF